ncbi:MAG: dihydroorotate dehydrogenase electron transfer subunit, partial [Atopobiaceae bacterium]|nr:dihydroorotate dehydrogenase electron transfer subunit [Atopobiaceae bacterium]
MDTDQASLHDFTVELNEPAAEGVYRMRIRSSVAHDMQPGEFMNLSVPGDGSHILRIPLSFSRIDNKGGSVELLYALVGEGTRRLSQMRVGDTSTVVGPCGKGWSLPKGEGRALLVAGGIGLPPILACARMLAQQRIGFDVVVGARTKSMMVFPDSDEVLHYGGVQLPENGWEGGYDPERIVTLTTDDGTYGAGLGKGMFATEGMSDLLKRRSYAQVYTCGPTPMMAAVAKIAKDHGVACQVSMERLMGCGCGACSCCNVALAKA